MSLKPRLSIAVLCGICVVSSTLALAGGRIIQYRIRNGRVQVDPVRTAKVVVPTGGVADSASESAGFAHCTDHVAGVASCSDARYGNGCRAGHAYQCDDGECKEAASIRLLKAYRKRHGDSFYYRVPPLCEPSFGYHQTCWRKLEVPNRCNPSGTPNTVPTPTPVPTPAPAPAPPAPTPSDPGGAAYFPDDAPGRVRISDRDQFGLEDAGDHTNPRPAQTDGV